MGIALNPEVQQSSTEEMVCKRDVLFKNPAGSNGYQLYQADNEQSSFTDVKSSSGNSEKVPKTSVNDQAHLLKPTLNGYSRKNCTVFRENPIIPCIKSYNNHPLPEAASNGITLSSIPEKTGSVGKCPVLSGSEKSRDPDIAPSVSFATTAKKTNSIRNFNLFNNNGILPGPFAEFPLNFRVSKMDDTPIFETEDKKIPNFQENGEKSMKERTSTHSRFVKPQALSGGVTASTSSLWKSNFPNFDMSLEPFPKTNSADLHKLLYQDVKAPVLLDSNSNKSLTEFILILKNWGRSGLDKAFNMPIFPCPDTESYFGKHLQHGLDLMNQLSTRICILMIAANELPNLNNRDRNRIRGNFISTGIKLWLMVNELELSAIQVINNMAGLGHIFTNLYTKVMGKLPSLSKAAEDFQDKIREFCSEMEKFL